MAIKEEKKKKTQVAKKETHTKEKNKSIDKTEEKKETQKSVEKEVNAKKVKSNHKKKKKGKAKKENFIKATLMEMKNVHFPNRKEMVKYSIATIIFIIFFGILFYAVDLIVAWLKMVI